MILEKIENLLQENVLVKENRISSKAKRTLIGLIKKPEKMNIDINGMKPCRRRPKHGSPPHGPGPAARERIRETGSAG